MELVEGEMHGAGQELEQSAVQIQVAAPSSS